MSDKRIIINADGYGFTPGITRGIEESIERGVVTSLSVNANFDAAFGLKPFIERNPRVSVGVHLNPMVGSPIAEPKDVPTLVNEKGEFHYKTFVSRLNAGQIDGGELEHELGLQVERVQSLVPEVTHIDGHRNWHRYPRGFKAYLATILKYRIPRMRTYQNYLCIEFPNRRMNVLKYYLSNPKRLLTHGYARWLMHKGRAAGVRTCDRVISLMAWGVHNRKPVFDSWMRVAEHCPRGVNEIFVHPGYVCDELRRWATDFLDVREEELKVMTDPRLREAFEHNGVQRISFHDL